MRIALATSLESRDGGVSKDAKCLNDIIELQGEGEGAKLSKRKRPGCSDAGLVRVGVAQLLTYWNGKVRTIIGDYINTSPASAIGAAETHSTTWNPSDKGINVTLSNGNLTATIAASSLTRSVVSVSSGAWYWECSSTLGGIGTHIGMANASEGAINCVGDTANSIGYDAAGGIIKGGVQVYAAPTYTTSDVIGIYYDADAATIDFYKNNVHVAKATGANVPSGVLFAAIGGDGSGGHGTGNFGAVAFTYTVLGAASGNLAPSAAGLPFSAQDNGSNAAESLLMFKNATQAWTLDTDDLVTQITDVDYPGTYAVTLTSLTRSGTVATATTAADTNFQVGSQVVIAGATPSDYNGTKTITGVTPSSAVSSDSIEITITRSGTTATAVSTVSPHGFENGQTITITGANQTEYNGNFVITWISATSFSFTVTVTTADVISPATGTPAYQPSAQNGFYTATTTVLTVVMDHAHGYATGASVGVTTVGVDYFNTTPNSNYVTGTITVTAGNSFTMPVSFTVGTAAGRIPPCTVRVLAVSISSITASGSTATVTTSAPHFLSGVDTVKIWGATPGYYNITDIRPTITGASTFTFEIPSAASPRTPATGSIFAQRNTRTGASFTFSISGSPTSPATGTITATGGRSTVPGIVYLNGRFGVMDVFGVVYTSAEERPDVWNPLEYLIAQAETGAGKCLAKSLSHVVAFKEWSTEFLWDAAAKPPGSPWEPVEGKFTKVGCASGFSVAEVGDNLVWVAQSRSAVGRSVYMMTGDGAQQKISTDDISRILDADDLEVVHAYGTKRHGHWLYVLTLVDSNITLIFDMNSQAWSQWSSLTLGASKSVSTITRTGDVATVTCAVPHTLNDGDPVLISGAAQSAYNGIKQIYYVSATVFAFDVTGSPVTPATGTILAFPYTETYLKFTKYANCGGLDLMLHESDGHLYRVDPTEQQDAGIPINDFSRSIRLDGGSSARKKMGALVFVGDSVADYIMVRFSDDDCATFTPYRRMEVLSLAEPRLRRNGAFSRRTIETRFIGDNPLRAEALEMEIQ